MKNKIELKKYIVTSLIILTCSLGLFLAINIYEYNTYKVNFNNKMSLIISILSEKYPSISTNEIIKILNNDKSSKINIFDKYGIDIKNESIVKINDKLHLKYLIIDIVFLIVTILLLLIIYLKYNKKREKEINEITKYIENINKKNYELKIETISEDELSILKNEIYKTTIMLKEIASNSNTDKLNLKKSLEDISHQLKTPLTSILIMIDNLIDNPDMDINTRNDFIMDIKREVNNINFLVQSILKLSKLDSNTIHFIKEDIEIKKIIDESIKNVSALCDLKNINIDINGGAEALINCDFKWQVEALTNIIKNAIEHALTKVIINIEDNKVYSKIDIINDGELIDKKDINHIFERFYKSKNATSDSIGIGLALSKTIIEQDNGCISVESNKDKTIFTIKYFK